MKTTIAHGSSIDVTSDFATLAVDAETLATLLGAIESARESACAAIVHAENKDA
jgi:hypothetical protein